MARQEFGKPAHVPQRELGSKISQLASSQLVPKLYLGTKMVAKLSLADKGGVPKLSLGTRKEVL